MENRFTQDCSGACRSKVCSGLGDMHEDKGPSTESVSAHDAQLFESTSLRAVSNSMLLASPSWNFRCSSAALPEACLKLYHPPSGSLRCSTLPSWIRWLKQVRTGVAA